MEPVNLQPEVPLPALQAAFVRRLNRFVVEIRLPESGTIATASLPNPGKLGEILLPGIQLGLVKGPAAGRHPWRVVTAELRSGQTVFLDTGKTNQVARFLLERKLIPGLTPYRIVRAEAPLPGTRSRVDFLVESDHHKPDTIRYVEVKSCTLFNGRYAMFPDAVTKRGQRHVDELAALGRGALLIVIHTDGCDRFVPDFHTDLVFAQTLSDARKRLPIFPVGLGWSPEGFITSIRTDISIPWTTVDTHLVDSGFYAVLLHLPTRKTIPTGALGAVTYPAGWYLYVGSAQRALEARTNRHRRTHRKRKHWHIDYLRDSCTWIDRYVIREPPARRTPLREAEIVRAFRASADGSIPGFGAGDSPCDSHLLRFDTDPRRDSAFMQVLLEQRRVSLDAADAADTADTTDTADTDNKRHAGELTPPRQA